MATARKSLRSVKTMAALVDRRRTRTPSGALLELSLLANEKERLQQELRAARRRGEEIQTRLREIAEKEERLQRFVKNPASSSDGGSNLPTEAHPRVQTREISY